MEIEAKVYVIANSPDLIRKTAKILEEDPCVVVGSGLQKFQPDAALPLSAVWYGASGRAEPTGGPAEWTGILRKCAAVLGNNGMVTVEYRSPDNPDDYLEYAMTTPKGNVSVTGRGSMLPWNHEPEIREDLSRVLEELMNGSSEYDRRMRARRQEKKAAERAAKGDFEIAGKVLKKYRGVGEEETIPDGVEVIGEAAFADLRRLEEYLMGDADSYDAPALVELTIPESVRTIETYAISYCENLQSVNIPSGVVKIGERAFEGCTGLESISVPGGVSVIEPFTFFLCETLGSVTLGEGTEIIDENAFDFCSSLKKITLPKSLKEIRKEAFVNCSALAGLNLPQGLRVIGSNAFAGCSSLKKVIVPDSVETIGAHAFRDCRNLKQLILPEKLKHLGEGNYLK